MSRRSILGLMYMMKGLQEHGADTHALLARYGLSEHQLNLQSDIDRALELRIIAESAEYIDDPAVGLKIGEFFPLAGYGPLMMLLLSARTAMDAVNMAVRYQSLTFLFSCLRFVPDRTCSAIALMPPSLPENVARIVVDGEISGTLKLLRDLQHAGLEKPLSPQRIDVPHSRPAYWREYATRFGCDVEFDQPCARIWLTNDVLAQPVPTADPMAHQLYQQQCDALLQTRSQPHAHTVLAPKIRSHLELFCQEFPSAPAVARTLGISERTLRRQLQQEGTSFRSLLDEVRSRQACKLLHQSRLSIDSLARQLGYTEPASFIRAFQRWNGCTPSAYRRAATQQQSASLP